MTKPREKTREELTAEIESHTLYSSRGIVGKSQAHQTFTPQARKNTSCAGHIYSVKNCVIL